MGRLFSVFGKLGEIFVDILESFGIDLSNWVERRNMDPERARKRMEELQERDMAEARAAKQDTAAMEGERKLMLSKVEEEIAHMRAQKREADRLVEQAAEYQKSGKTVQAASTQALAERSFALYKQMERQIQEHQAKLAQAADNQEQAEYYVYVLYENALARKTEDAMLLFDGVFEQLRGRFNLQLENLAGLGTTQKNDRFRQQYKDNVERQQGMNDANIRMSQQILQLSGSKSVLAASANLSDQDAAEFAQIAAQHGLNTGSTPSSAASDSESKKATAS